MKILCIRTKVINLFLFNWSIILNEYQYHIMPAPFHQTRSAFIHSLLITGQLRNGLAHLLIIVDLESLVLCHTGELDVLFIQFLLHHLLQRLQNERLGLGQRQGAVVFVLQLSLRTLTSGTDGLCIVSVEGTRRLGVVSRTVRN